MAIVTIVGSGMMGSALAFPARENGHEVRLVGTHLDREIIETCKKTDRHPKFTKDFPAGIKYYQIEELKEALSGADITKLFPGARGTVKHVDDMGTIHVRWDCGSSLGVVYGEDSCKVITE